MLPTGFIVIGRRGGLGRRSAAKLQGARLYREEQGYGWPWPGMLLVLVGVVTCAAVIGPFGFGMWQQLVLGKPWGDKPMPDAALYVIGPMAILLSFLPFAALFTRLLVEVQTDGIRIQLVRIRGAHVIAREEVRGVSLTHIGPFGWGESRGCGRLVYRMAGSEGVELELTGGKKVVIGSERPRAFLAAVQAMLHPKPER